jgi:hypothetical protein
MFTGRATLELAETVVEVQVTLVRPWVEGFVVAA